MELLDDDWLAALASGECRWLASVPDVVVQVDVAGSPSGARPWHLAIADGAIRSCAAGKAGAPDLVLSVTWADAQAIANGDLDANAAYMLGRLKTDGPTGPLLALLAGLRTEAGREARRALASATS